MSVELLNFGCRLNLAEGEAIRAQMTDADDLIIVNSCAVTAEAERQARQAIRKAARARPSARIVLTGCGAETEAFRGMPEIAEIVRNDDKRAFAGLDARPSVSGAHHARAFIEVQNGCDHDCTFCVTTLARGASRSIPAGAVIEAVQAALDRGQQEVVLTGIDLTSYGADLPGAPTLGQLVERILKACPALPRLRLSSLDSVEIDARLFELITGEKRVMPYVHLSLQSGNDMILKRMKRRHSRADAVALVSRLKARRPEVSIGADLIAGFPTETEAMFADTMALLKDCDIALAHIFPYSPRPGTAAARMPQVPRALIKERAAQLRAKAEARKASWLASHIGTTQHALIELDRQTGHANNFARVRLETPLPTSNMRGTMIAFQVTGSDGTILTGVPV